MNPTSGASSAVLAGLVLGVLISIPPGPAGVIILNLSLRGIRDAATRALAAFLGAEILVMIVGSLFYSDIARLASLRWTKPAAGVFLIVFAASAWRAVGTERGFASTSMSAVFRITILNPAIWLGAASVLTIASTQLSGGLLPRVLFVAALECGSLGWYLGIIFGVRRVPVAFRGALERAAVLVIGFTGLYFASAIVTVGK